MKHIVLQPSFYDKFECIGSKCKNNCCCNTWTINFTKEEFRNIKRKMKSEEFKEIFQNAFNIQKGSDYYTIKFDEEERCKFLNENGLCKMYTEVGPENMGLVCKVFPRFCTRYIDKYERFLSIGCEEVINLLIEEKEGILLEVKQTEITEVERISSTTVPKEFLKKDPIFHYWTDIKMLILGVLQNREYDFGERMVVLGLAMKKMDEMNKKGQQYKLKEYIQGFITDFNDIKNKDVYSKIFQNINRDGYIRAMQVLTSYFLNPTENVSKFKDIVENRIQLKRSAMVDDVEKLKENKVQVKIEFDNKKYSEAIQEFKEFLKGREYWIENVMIEGFLTARCPFRIPGGIWKNYCAMAVTYSVFLFTLTCCLKKDSTKEDFIYYVVQIARTMFHNEERTKEMEKHLNETESNTLAHMAMLVL